MQETKEIWVQFLGQEDSPEEVWQEIYKISLEHAVLSESKEVVKYKQHPTMIGVCQRHKCQMKELPMVKARTI